MKYYRVFQINGNFSFVCCKDVNNLFSGEFFFEEIEAEEFYRECDFCVIEKED